MMAKAGDKISEKARKATNGLVGQETVSPKAEGQRGQWFCIDCGYAPQHNMDANGHESEKPKHRLAWRNFETATVEEADPMRLYDLKTARFGTVVLEIEDIKAARKRAQSMFPGEVVVSPHLEPQARCERCDSKPCCCQTREPGALYAIDGYETTLRDLLAANAEDPIPDADVERIKALPVGGSMIVGGGANAELTIERVR